jgi:hypothetical protein
MTKLSAASTIEQWLRGGEASDAVLRIRDLLIVNCGSHQLVIACDSNASVGN